MTINTISTPPLAGLLHVVQNEPLLTVVMLVVVAFPLLVKGYFCLRRTTLLGSWWWVMAVLAGFVVSEGILAWVDSQQHAQLHEPLRLIAASGLFCPVMSVLGAKRPQHVGWHFIVLSLWVVVALPAIEGWFLGSDAEVEISNARGWFLWILIVLGLLNYGVTRFTFSAFLMAAAQVAMWSAHLPLVHQPTSPSLAYALMIGAVAFVAPGLPRRDDLNGYQRAWLDFRDMYGGLWSAQFLDRINAAAKMFDWPVALTWTGFYRVDGNDAEKELPLADQKELRPTMANLLRRFVSPEWTDARLPKKISGR